MVTREDQALFFNFQPIPVLFLFDLQVHKTGKDFQQVVWQQNFIPQIAGGVFVCILGRCVTRAAFFGAFVKRQEEGVIPRQFGGHKHFILADGKMHQCATFEGEQRLRLIGDRVFRQTRFLILFNRVMYRLLEF
ncbi:hypothetical protein D3C75_1140350 [compost metagenome]